MIPSASNASGYQWATDSNFNNLVDSSKVTSTGELTYSADQTENTKYYYRAINSNGCVSETKSVTIKVLQGVSNLTITNSGISVCQGEPITFVANASNVTGYIFYDENGSEIENLNTLNLTTHDLAPKVYNYNVKAFNSNGCTTSSLPFTFTIKPIPNKPTVTGQTIYCNGEQVKLMAASNGAINFRWYTDISLNNEVTENLSGDKKEILSYTSTIAERKTYYVVGENREGCVSNLTSVEIVINPQVGNVIVNGSGTSFCQGETVELTASALNATKNYEWFTDAQGTIPASNITGIKKSTFKLDTNTNTKTGTFNLYVRGRNSSNCNSELTKVTYTIINSPVNLEIKGKTTICLGESISLSLNADFALNYLWYLDINEINPIDVRWLSETNGSKIEFTPNELGNIKLYFKASNTNCSTELQSINILVLEKPTLVNVTNNNKSFCSNEKAEFEASAFAAEKFEWWKNNELTLPVESTSIKGNNKNTLTIETSILGKGNYTYYVVAVNSSGCKTEPIPVNFTINSNPLEASVSGDSVICVGDYLEMSVVSEGATSFKWYYDSAKNFPLNPLHILGNGSEIKVPANNQENGFIYVEGINENGCATDLISFSYEFNTAPNNINVYPINQTVCVGQKIEIDAGADNASVFLWWKDANATVPLEEEKTRGNTHNKVLYNTTTEDIGKQVLYVQAKSQSGCTTELVPVHLTVLDLPKINVLSANSKDNQYLFEEKIKLSFKANNYKKYRILKDNVVLQDWKTNGNSFVITRSATGENQGIYKIEVSNNYCIDSKEIEIFVFNDKIEILHNKSEAIKVKNGIENLFLTKGQFINFDTNFSNDDYHYTWNFGDGFKNNGKNSKHFFNVQGVFQVVLQITNKQNNASRRFNFQHKIHVNDVDNQINIDGLDIPENTEIKFSPNPFKNKIILTMNNVVEESNTVLRIYNANGLVFFVEQFQVHIGNNKFIWNNPLGNATQGIYFATLNSGSTVKKFKLIKE